MKNILRHLFSPCNDKFLKTCVPRKSDYLDREGVPHHYNSSEWAIRILKVKTQVSRGFRTQADADQYVCFHSILETAKRNGEARLGTLYQLIN